MQCACFLHAIELHEFIHAWPQTTVHTILPAIPLTPFMPWSQSETGMKLQFPQVCHIVTSVLNSGILTTFCEGKKFHTQSRKS